MTTDNDHALTPTSTTTDHTVSEIEANFWATPDPLRDEARELIRSGAVNENTTLADAWRAQEQRNQVAQK